MSTRSPGRLTLWTTKMVSVPISISVPAKNVISAPDCVQGADLVAREDLGAARGRLDRPAIGADDRHLAGQHGHRGALSDLRGRRQEPAQSEALARRPQPTS